MADSERNPFLKIIHSGIYIIIAVECIILFAPLFENTVLRQIIEVLGRLKFMKFPYVKLYELLFVFLIVIGGKPRKKIKVNIGKEIILPIIIGLFFLGLTFVVIEDAVTVPNTYFKYFNTYSIIYILSSFIAIVFLINGFQSIFKIMRTNLGKDRFNIEEESFQQVTEKIETEYSVNIPTRFYYKKKWNNGWLNIDLFRGSIVVGTPGSGKSYGIINPTIRQTIAKGFSMLLYDVKYPDLGEIAYLSYLKQKKINKNYRHTFSVLNPADVERSIRLNPIRKEYLLTLGQAQNIAETLVMALQKGGDSGGTKFFTVSSVNFLSCCIYFLAKKQDGKYCSLPHLMAFLNFSYEEIFTALFTVKELKSLLSNFQEAHKNETYEMLDAQISSLKVYVARLATKESFWIFTEPHDKPFNFKISDPTDPSILVLANNDEMKVANSNLFASVISRVLTEVNQEANLPTAVIADEFPTVYFHEIENTIAVARSKKVGVMLGLQELTQLKQSYKKEIADTLSSIIGNIFSGSVRDNSTLTWLETLIGKAKQISHSVSVSNSGTNITTNEKADYLVPKAKIGTLKTGQLVGILADSSLIDEDNYLDAPRSAFSAKINLDNKAIAKEKSFYRKVPKYYKMVNDETENEIAKAKKGIKNLLANKKISFEEKQSSMLKLKNQLNQAKEDKHSQINEILTINFDRIYREAEILKNDSEIIN